MTQEKKALRAGGKNVPTVKKTSSALILLAALLLATGCMGTGDGGASTGDTMDIDTNDLENPDNPVAIVETNKGTFTFELYAERAPTTVENFVGLANRGFYDGLTFHRYEPGFVIQGGDPKGDGTGGSDETIPLETNPQLKHVEGAVGMARSQAPDSASSQWYVTLDAAHFLDGDYAVFGKVIDGMDVVKQLRKGDRMQRVTIEE